MPSEVSQPRYGRPFLPKVRHDGTDKSDPNFSVYHDIQQQNDFAVLQLNAMGYNGDLLWAEFRPDKIREQMDTEAVVTTVPQTCERQDTRVAAHNAERGNALLRNGRRDPPDGQ